MVQKAVKPIFTDKMSLVASDKEFQVKYICSDQHVEIISMKWTSKGLRRYANVTIRYVSRYMSYDTMCISIPRPLSSSSSTVIILFKGSLLLRFFSFYATVKWQINQ